MRLDRHRILVGVVLAVVFMAGGGSIQAAAQANGPTRTVTRAGFPGQLELWLALRHAGSSRAVDSALALRVAGGAVSSRFRNPIAPTVNVGQGPNDVAVDQASHTAYVTNGTDNTVSIVDTARCSARNTTGCSQVAPTVAVGMVPVSDVFDPQNHTVYVTNVVDGTISMINAATCNAAIVSGCSHVTTASVGSGPDFVGVDTATHTVYVVDVGDNMVTVVDAATCNATTTSGCGHISTVAVGNSPTALAVDETNHTVYVANGLGLSTPGSVSMINASTCNATITTGCGRAPRSARASIGASWVAIDPTTHTVYVATGPAGLDAGSLGVVDVINADTCNATMTSGCRKTPLAVTVGSVGIGVVVDPETHSVFVANEEDSTISVIDGSRCNAGFTDGCDQRPPTVAVGFNPGTLAVDLSTDTVYVPNQNENTVSVLDGAACTLTHQSGCRHAAQATTVGNGPAGVAVDPATDTVYVTNQNDNDLSVIDGAICNASVRFACGRTWPTVATGNVPQAVAVDERTHTVYVADWGGGSGNTVSVINAATCNATNHSGCGQTPATITVGGGPFDLAINEATDTVYVANSNDNTVSVIDGATCNATDHSGCGQTPPTVLVGNGSDKLAVDQATNTIYVSNSGDNTVSVIDGVACNASNHSGCGQSAPTVSVGNGPGAIVVNQATHTVYVANGFFTGTPATTVSVIDSATCNARVTTGCGQTPATMATGGDPFDIGVAEATDTVYVSSIIDSETEVFNGATCNATVTSGCAQSPVSVPNGGWSSGLAVSQSTDTIYVSDNVDGEVSFFRAR